jgi:Fe-S cluster biogenesis protein NfuA
MEAVQEANSMVMQNPSEISMDTETQVRALLENLNAYIEHYHGGSVQMISMEGDTVKVRLGGACLGCPLSPTTLHGWVAGTVHQFFPNLQVVAA